MIQILKRSSDVILIFMVFLVAFAILGRILFFDFTNMWETKDTWAAFNFESFSRSLYSMIVAVSTTNFPMSMLKAYSQSRMYSIFFVINSFLINFVLLNLIMATFYFYY